MLLGEIFSRLFYIIPFVDNELLCFLDGDLYVEADQGGPISCCHRVVSKGYMRSMDCLFL